VKTGIQYFYIDHRTLDSRLRGNDNFLRGIVLDKQGYFLIGIG